MRQLLLVAAFLALPGSAFAGNFVSFAPYAGYDSLANGDLGCKGGDIQGPAFGARIGRGNEHGFTGNLDLRSYGGKGKCGGSLSLIGLGFQGEIPLTDNKRMGQVGVGAALGLVFGSLDAPQRRLQLQGLDSGSYDAFLWYRVRLGVAGEGGVLRMFHLMPIVGWRGSSITYFDKDEVDQLGTPLDKPHHLTASGPYAQLALVMWFGQPAN